jgi:hypothetical protein
MINVECRSDKPRWKTETQLERISLAATRQRNAPLARPGYLKRHS